MSKVTLSLSLTQLAVKKHLKTFVSALNAMFTELYANDQLMKTVKVTIGAVGVSGCDHNFTTAANYTEQVIDFGHVLPARAKVVDITSVTDAAFTACTTLVAEVGASSSGAEYVTSASIKALGAITTMSHALSLAVAPVDAVAHVFVAATPDSGTTWAALTAGKVSYYITYIDLNSRK